MCAVAWWYATPELGCRQQHQRSPVPALAAIRVAAAEMCTYNIWRLADVEPVSPASILGWFGSVVMVLLCWKKEVLQVLLCWRAAQLVSSAALWLYAGCVCAAQRLGCLCGVLSCARGAPCTWLGRSQCCSAHSSFAWMCYCSCTNRVCCVSGVSKDDGWQVHHSLSQPFHRAVALEPCVPDGVRKRLADWPWLDIFTRYASRGHFCILDPLLFREIYCRLVVQQQGPAGASCGQCFKKLIPVQPLDCMLYMQACCWGHTFCQVVLVGKLWSQSLGKCWEFAFACPVFMRQATHQCVASSCVLAHACPCQWLDKAKLWTGCAHPRSRASSWLPAALG
jgi:hypothetical protein